MSQPVNILGVDPGKKCGIAEINNGKLLYYDTVDGDNVFLARDMLIDIDTLVIEDQYFRIGKLKGIKTLLYRRFIWQVMAKYARVAISKVPPSTWQSYYKIKRGDKDTIQRVAASLVLQHGDSECKQKMREDKGLPPQDAADAICIAYWYFETLNKNTCESPIGNKDLCIPNTAKKT